MNKAKLKSYAPQARIDFIAAVTARANLLGLSEKSGKLEIVASRPQGDVTVIAGQAWPIKVHYQRQQLIARIQKDGFAETMEAVAYTWFNRFAALRYMELHDYLGHGHRALSSSEGTLPDILTHATDIVHYSAENGGLPGLKPSLVVEMKLDGNRDGELYRMLLVAQCNALSNVMPFLFERIDDETELLLPDNLLRTDSVIAKLVDSIEEEDWKAVEIIGWLYQFYISEKKDMVMGKMVKSGDIPAATQLFTPNWIVQYLVQNSVGRLWLMANPSSSLAVQWPYYIAPADQTVEVNAQLDGLIRARIDEDGDSLNPESIRLLDPACGSGHILVEAYEVLKAMYLERGYQPRVIPRLILEKNLYGLDIDDRAAQMAGFALLMKARADDRRLFNQPIMLNVLSLQESNGLDAEELSRALAGVTDNAKPQIWESEVNNGFGDVDLFPSTRPQLSLCEFGQSPAASNSIEPAVISILKTFENAKTFGSLIEVPESLRRRLDDFENRLHQAVHSGDLHAKAAVLDLLPFVAQARILGMRFDAVVANPPYMGGKGMNPLLKDYSQTCFPDSKSDLFAMFIERGFQWCKPAGFNNMVTMQGWMFLSSFEKMRKKILSERNIFSLVQIGYNSFPEMNSKVAQACAFCIGPSNFSEYKGKYINLNSELQSEDKNSAFLNRDESIVHESCQIAFAMIPGAPIAYWLSQAMLKAFDFSPISLSFFSDGLTKTGDNAKYLRMWWEVSIDSARDENKYRKCYKGGDFRRYFGNNDYLIKWDEQARRHYKKDIVARISPEYLWDKEGITWTKISSSAPSFRKMPSGGISETGGPAIFPKSSDNLLSKLAFLNSVVAMKLLKATSPTLNFQTNDILNLPFHVPNSELDDVNSRTSELLNLYSSDERLDETSLDFERNPLISKAAENPSLRIIWEQLRFDLEAACVRAKHLEEENNRIFINAYGLQDEISAEVPDFQMTLAHAERVTNSRQLISYAVGCMMGRYSLEEDGVIYAHAGNVGFDATRYTSFPADADGIVPLNDELWFEDEAASRIREFLLAGWGSDALDENIAWLAESLGIKAGETPDETVRRYLADRFFNDHLQTYKKRPIYWLFSSGKLGAFQALVYMHRYHEGTLARMRAEYVVPLTGKIQSRIDMLEKDAMTAASTASRAKLAKVVETLKKKQVELLTYDEQLRHYADMRIAVDLDEGVKVNYAKFGNLLAEVRAVAGNTSDD